ncbi:hypothetical protein L1987_32746 [Smallanthus sonchifolius]|uniref:Uncharacterized protein n=1 Tax=Smallanthus sonchifolius TaxID=185202 RepID=A0ACB9HNX1_9ASTR|nr:hypothetical protein L1987_32746 [Smallanthus sonchifolius]
MNFNEKKTTHTHASPSNLFAQGLNERKFGCMPSLPADQKDHEESNTLIGINLSINGWQTEVNHMKNQTYRGSSVLNISNQKNIAQRIEYTQIPFGSDLELNHNDEFGSRITKARNTLFQQTISGLRDAGQGSNDQNFISFRRQASEEFPDLLKDLDVTSIASHSWISKGINGQMLRSTLDGSLVKQSLQNDERLNDIHDSDGTKGSRSLELVE